MIELTKEEILKATECCQNNGSCAGCPLDNVSMAELGDRTCLQLLLGQYRGLIEASNTALDIPRIIDEAMEKKNRSVTIFIGAHGTTVNVYPYQETKPHWIEKDGRFSCSECGYISDFYPYRYCPDCGEELKGVEHLEGADDGAGQSLE